MRMVITGGTGSLGQALVKEMAWRHDLPEKLILFSRSDQMHKKLSTQWPFTLPPVNFIQGDVRNAVRLVDAFRGVDVVIHAAAMKLIDRVSYEPEEACLTNITGTMNVLRAARVCGVKKVLLVSTDKACVDFHAPVVLETGRTKSIAKLVREKDSSEVRTLTQFGVKSAKITGWYKTKLHGRSMIGVGFEDGPINHGQLNRAWVTEDHRILTTVGWKAASELTPEIELVTADVAPSGLLMGMLIGCLMGDGHCGQELRFGHAEDQKQWLEIIHQAFINLGARPMVCAKRKNPSHQNFWTFSVPRTAFTRWLNRQTYQNKKRKVPRGLVAKYWSIPLLAAWYLDDGCVADKDYKNARIGTQGYGQDDVEWLAEFLTLKGLPSYAYKHKVAGKYYWELRFTVEGTERLFELVGPYVPPSLRYKVPPWAQPFEEKKWILADCVTQFTSPANIIRVPATTDQRAGRKLGVIRPKPNPRIKRDVYCLDVENTHNFIVNGVVLHNCEPINAYGVSKAAAEYLTINSNHYGAPIGTISSVVRYGNVLGSKGSVTWLWKAARARGGPIDITDPAMTRFLITFSRAYDLIGFALAQMRGGEVFIPKLKSVTVGMLADAMGIPEDARKVTGLRSGGEKRHEVLWNPEEATRLYDLGEGYCVYPGIAQWGPIEPQGTKVADVPRDSLQATWLDLDTLKGYLLTHHPLEEP